MSTTLPPRKPLRIIVSSFDGHVARDGAVALLPDDPDYEREYTFAVEAFQRFGEPMPYASQGLIDRTLAARAEAAAS